MPDSDVDLLIIGSGPAGLTAAQYGARACLKTLVLEQLAPGGQVLLIDILENYPGNAEKKDAQGNIISGIKTGYEVAEDMHKQALAFGASFLSGKALELKKDGQTFTTVLAGGKEVKALAVILATGATHRSLDIPGEQQFMGRGVSYCASCDGAFFKGKKIFVVGGGDSACDDAQYLSRLSPHVVLIHRRDRFRAQPALVQRVMQNKNIEIRFNTVIREIKGEQKISSVVLDNAGRVYEDAADAVFIFAGIIPQSELVSKESSLRPELDEGGYIITNQKMASSVAGLFAAGDVRSGTFKQVVVAAGEGAIAAHSAAQYIDGLRGISYT
ncbi:MAG: FAD-dependent oxidoreductase [Treponema sp.]|nr:FAD-dependent oxidoreductase [Treponema sp.]